MGSDETDFDEEALDQFERERGSTSLPLRQTRATQIPTAEDLASSHIQECLEEGNESIDLSYV
jgi:hypothetical protein